MKKLLLTLAYLAASIAVAWGQNPTLVYQTNGVQLVPSTTHAGKVTVGLYTNALGADKYYHYDGTNYNWAASTATTPGGSTTQVQYNNAGAFGGMTGFLWTAANSRAMATNSGTTSDLFQAVNAGGQQASVKSTSTTGAGELAFINNNGETATWFMQGTAAANNPSKFVAFIPSGRSMVIRHADTGNRLEIGSANTINQNNINNSGTYTTNSANLHPYSTSWSMLESVTTAGNAMIFNLNVASYNNGWWEQGTAAANNDAFKLWANLKAGTNYVFESIYHKAAFSGVLKVDLINQAGTLTNTVVSGWDQYAAIGTDNVRLTSPIFTIPNDDIYYFLCTVTNKNAGSGGFFYNINECSVKRNQ